MDIGLKNFVSRFYISMELLQGQLGHIDEGVKMKNKKIIRCFLKVKINPEKWRKI